MINAAEGMESPKLRIGGAFNQALVSLLAAGERSLALSHRVEHRSTCARRYVTWMNFWEERGKSSPGKKNGLSAPADGGQLEVCSLGKF